MRDVFAFGGMWGKFRLRTSCVLVLLVVFMPCFNAGAQGIVSRPLRVYGMGPVTSVAYSPGGHYALAGHDHRATLWDVEGGYRIREFIGHADRVTCVTFSPDGARIATGSADYTVKIWDTATGAQLATLGHPNEVTSLAWSPGGVWIATGCQDGHARLWDSATGTEQESMTLGEMGPLPWCSLGIRHGLLCHMRVARWPFSVCLPANRSLTSRLVLLAQGGRKVLRCRRMARS